MKNKITGFLAGILALAILAGCETTSDSTKKPADDPAKNQLTETLRPKLTEAEKANLAEVILDGMLAGVSRDDYAMYSKNFFKGLLEKYKINDFKDINTNMKKEMGEYQSKSYMGMLYKPLGDVFLWKAKFSNTNEDVLIRLFLIEEEGKYKVAMFSIGPF
ncbi:MAG TPA: hypothetical protein DCZ94_12835 [Lentisphaeria bacterium]|nr:MAG: hypothetical protein A2X48_10980 [Lentisphaerae bacterium GWF2_49_21]HBC87833.1 hypothetical protein [Lentisphaeria bacterium]